VNIGPRLDRTGPDWLGPKTEDGGCCGPVPWALVVGNLAF